MTTPTPDNGFVDIDLPSGRVRCARSGLGSPLVLLHEMGGSLESWNAVTRLVSENFEVIRWDSRGSGRSSSLREPITAADLAADVGLVLDRLAVTGPVDLVGLAFGGSLAMAYAANAPERIRRLVAINPPVDIEPPAIAALLERARAVEASGMQAAADAVLARSFAGSGRVDQGVARAYRERFLAQDPRSYAHILRALAGIRLDGVLERIVVPTLVLSGVTDAVRPSAAVEAASRRLPNAAFRTLSCGHIAAVQAPAEVATALLAFLPSHRLALHG